MQQGRGSDTELAWTGERLVSTVSGDVALEHLHRYALAIELARDKRVLDVASGEGYGSSLLARVASRVTGVDIDANSVSHATRKYALENLEFLEGSATKLPVASESVDLVVSFETLEHLAEHEQMFCEIKRVLAPGGTLIISTPDRQNYSDIPKYANPFHVRELYADEFAQLIGRHFTSTLIFGQRLCEGSLLVPIAGSGADQQEFRSYRGNYTGFHGEAGLRFPIYLVAIATNGTIPALRNPSFLEGDGIPTNKDLSLLERDRVLREAESEIVLREREIATTRFVAAQRETERDRLIDNQERALAHQLNELSRRVEEIGARDRRIVEMDQQLTQLAATLDQFNHTLTVTQCERDQAEAGIAVAQQSLNEKARLLTEKDEQLVQAHETLHRLTRSRSWRWTAPLRASGQLARGLRRNVRVAMNDAFNSLKAVRRDSKPNLQANPRQYGRNDPQSCLSDEERRVVTVARQDPGHVDPQPEMRCTDFRQQAPRSGHAAGSE